jgi:iron complex outermembrane recepter protein
LITEQSQSDRGFCGQDRRGKSALTLIVVLTLFFSLPAYAQRSDEDAVAEASDAFGMTVGREAIGIYSVSSVRGFNPAQAGNLCIDGLYFDEVNPATPPTRIVRSSAVYVGIAAQGYVFPAPTGVVDYQLRTPGDEAVVSTLNGYSTYGESYDETDFAVPLLDDRLSVGGGIGYTHNATYDIAGSTDEWTSGFIARWQPTDSLVIKPFWGMTHHVEYGEKPFVFIGDSGVPRFRSINLSPQPWAGFSFVGQDFGTTGRLSFGDGWLIAAGIFRSLAYEPVTYSPLLLGVGNLDQGDYQISAFPTNSSGSTSGEVRLAKSFETDALLNTVYFRVTGRDSSVESGGESTVDIGPGTTTYSPYVHPNFDMTPPGDVRNKQWTPGGAYRGVWRKRVELTLAVQKVIYERNLSDPQHSPIPYKTRHWLFSGAASGRVTTKLLAYGSYTRGFEDIGNAPVNAINAYQPVPSELTWQVDAGIRYQLVPKLQLVAGVFEIDKPYYNLDSANLFRLLGTTSNRGAEFSLTGDLTDRLNVVSGIVLIQPKVRYLPGAVSGQTGAVAVGPVPGYMSTYFQYHPESVPGLTIGATIQFTSSRYAVYPAVDLPAFVNVGADIRYKTKLFGHNTMLWLELYNLGDVYGLTPNASGQLNSLDGRGSELSLEIDI